MKNRSFPSSILSGLRRLFGSEHMVMTILAVVVGSLVGSAVILFREVISLIQTAFYGSGSERLFANADALHWWQILFIPIIGGLIVGLLAHFLMPKKRPEGMADVIEASALRSGRMSSRTGLFAALTSAVSIGAGASVGREAPAVHLGASLAGWMGRRLGLSRSLTRTLLAGGIAAAVAASFNAPIAGVLFASEVIIGHYALNAFAPVVIASVAGTAISRVWFGNFPAFSLDQHVIASFWEFPAFAGLGVVIGIIAITFMHAMHQAQRLGEKIPAPVWLKPALAGLVLGLMGLVVPEVLGIGYGITEQALLVKIPLVMLLAFAVAKIAATAVSLGWGFGGGVFSPSLVIGAMIGGAYGIVATSTFPEYSSGSAAYTLVGMGAMAAAVMGAPISTTLIIFEMTGDYPLTLGVMIAIVIATEITQQFYGRSFFAEQLNRRGVDLKGGFEAEILNAV
ncbi:MAG: chloride channel protein, partial [Rhodospirillales bacterium]